jgi:hypothetical protein
MKMYQDEGVEGASETKNSVLSVKKSRKNAMGI